LFKLSVEKQQNLIEEAHKSKVQGELTGRRFFRLCPFSFPSVRFCSEGILDEPVRVRMTTQDEGMRLIIEFPVNEIL
jgi:hypothetical protein